MLRAYGIRPRRRFGQHFLISSRILDRILDAAGLTAADSVLEVGAGIGTLTVALAERAGRVTAIEMDRILLPALEAAVAPHRNVTLVCADAMRLDLGHLLDALPHPRKVVSNLPYNIASPLIVTLLEAGRGISRMVFTVQREVARRLVASPGSKDYGALSLAVQYRAHARAVARVSASAFYPPPEVTSEIVRLDVRAQPAVPVADEALFFRVIRAAFAQRRKMLRNALAAGLGLAAPLVESAASSAGVDPRRRGEDLDLHAFAALTAALAQQSGGKVPTWGEEHS